MFQINVVDLNEIYMLSYIPTFCMPSCFWADVKWGLHSISMNQTEIAQQISEYNLNTYFHQNSFNSFGAETCRCMADSQTTSPYNTIFSCISCKQNYKTWRYYPRTGWPNFETEKCMRFRSSTRVVMFVTNMEIVAAELALKSWTS